MVRKSEEKTFGRPWRRWEGNFKTYLANTETYASFHMAGNCLTKWVTNSFLRKTLIQGVVCLFICLFWSYESLFEVTLCVIRPPTRMDNIAAQQCRGQLQAVRCAAGDRWYCKWIQALTCVIFLRSILNARITIVVEISNRVKATWRRPQYYTNYRLVGDGSLLLAAHHPGIPTSRLTSWPWDWG